MSGTTVTCPRCRRDVFLGATFQNVTIQGAAMNIAVTCAHCSTLFDAAPGGDGTFSTIGGRLHRVAGGVRLLAKEARAHSDTLPRLTQVLREHQGSSSTADLAAAIDEATDGHFGEFARWLRENQWLAEWVGAGAAVAAFLLTLVLMLTSPSHDGASGGGSTEKIVVQVVTPASEIEQMIKAALQQVQQSALPSRPESQRRQGRAPARNRPCACGSGMKTKHCCGRRSPSGSSR